MDNENHYREDLNYIKKILSKKFSPKETQLIYERIIEKAKKLIITNKN